MLYFLLSIIAVGVLLNSEAGQTILGFFAVGGLLYLGFWIVVIAFVFFTSSTFVNGVSYLFQSICILIGFLGILFLIYKGVGYLSKTINNIKEKINKKYPKIRPFCQKHKRLIRYLPLTFVILFTAILTAVIMYYAQA